MVNEKTTGIDADSDDERCGQFCRNRKQTPHQCPKRAEINNDESECECCDDCERMCADER